MEAGDGGKVEDAVAFADDMELLAVQMNENQFNTLP